MASRAVSRPHLRQVVFLLGTLLGILLEISSLLDWVTRVGGRASLGSTSCVVMLTEEPAGRLCMNLQRGTVLMSSQ